MWIYELTEKTQKECAVCCNRSKRCNTDIGCKIFRPLKEWSELGHQILKGQKATKINGINKFHISQVGSRYIPKERKISAEDSWFSENIECPINM